MIPWGDAATWALALLTSGSVLLGVYIFHRDQREKDRSEARLVVCGSAEREKRPVTIVRNFSKRTIVDVMALVPAQSGPEPSTHYEVKSMEGILPPEEQPMDEAPSGGYYVKARYVAFQDADGVFWVRDIDKGDLARVRMKRSERGSELIKAARRRSATPLGQSIEEVVRFGRSQSVRNTIEVVDRVED